MAYESVALYGLVIAARRKVSYGRLDPARAREVFIEGALVAGELDTKLPFFAHNRALVREVEDLEHRARRQDVLVDDRAIFALLRRAAARRRCATRARSRPGTARRRRRIAKLLFLAKADLMRHGAESVTEELFPRQLRIGEHAFALAYRFEPGHPLDGVTMNVPLALLNQVDEAAIDWLVPGMVREKVAWTMKALPKRVRTLLVPVPEHVTAFLERVKPGERRIADEVLAYASRLAGERLDADVWSKDELPGAPER